MFHQGKEKNLMALLDFMLRDFPQQTTPSVTGLNSTLGYEVCSVFGWDVENLEFEFDSYAKALLAAYFLYRAKCAIPALATDPWTAPLRQVAVHVWKAVVI